MAAFFIWIGYRISDIRRGLRFHVIRIQNRYCVLGPDTERWSNVSKPSPLEVRKGPRIAGVRVKGCPWFRTVRIGGDVDETVEY